MKNILSKSLLALTLSFSLNSAFAQSDSVAVFHRPEKVLIQINEGDEGTRRLIDMMENLKQEKQFHVSSKDENLIISCGRGAAEVASCIFKFLPGKNVNIVNKQVDASISLAELKLESVSNFEIYFESSMKDKFLLKITDGILSISASKKQL
jgi:hypothetical protein